MSSMNKRLISIVTPKLCPIRLRFNNPRQAFKRNSTLVAGGAKMSLSASKQGHAINVAIQNVFIIFIKE